MQLRNGFLQNLGAAKFAALTYSSSKLVNVANTPSGRYLILFEDKSLCK